MFKRVSIAFFTLCVVLGLLIVNMGIIIADIGSSPATKSQSTKKYLLSSSRGMIYDRNMERIVNSESEEFAVCLPTTSALKFINIYAPEDERNALYETLQSGKIGIFKTPVTFNKNDIKSIAITNRYGENQPLVHLIGHLDENGVGVMGLEKAYNSLLSRQNGQLNAVWSVDALGNILLGDGIKIESEKYLSSSGIQLTIDLRIQEIAENALENNNINKGAVVILDSNTNEILAMASIPTFNPLDLGADINNSDKPFINRAITPYSVGSIFKPFVATVAIENNIDLTYNCTGTIKIGNTNFSCSNHTAHGEVNMKTATEKSCNTYFIALGQKVGAEKLLSLCSDFGLGKEIELADNFYLNTGNLPTTGSINSPQALANLSFGQGELLASPLQMAVAYSTFANDGFYRPPTLMKAIIDENKNAIQKVTLPEKYKILNDTTAKKIDSYLESVVTNGNGNKAFSTLVSNRGKTATAQSGWYENGREINHTWFCGYFAVKEKTYVVAIFKEDGISGANDCAPVFKEISENMLQLD